MKIDEVRSRILDRMQPYAGPPKKWLCFISLFPSCSWKQTYMAQANAAFLYGLNVVHGRSYSSHYVHLFMNYILVIICCVYCGDALGYRESVQKAPSEME